VATAVATMTTSVCDIPPLYICNPFEYDSSGTYIGNTLQTQFNNGAFHGKMIRLHPGGSDTHNPGNFGFLQMPGSPGADAINDFFAGIGNPTCYDSNTVTTKTGASDAIRQGINTRFDIYEGQYAAGGANSFKPYPAQNVRKGAIPYVGPGNSGVDYCVDQGAGGPKAKLSDDHVYDITEGRFDYNSNDDFAYGLPDNDTMVAMNNGASGAMIGSSSAWNIDRYFQVNYGVTPGSDAPDTTSPHPDNVTSSRTGLPPSRYDVYLAEISNNWHLIPSVGNPSGVGESGGNQCGQDMSPVRSPQPAEPDRRVLVAAIIDCKSQSATGGGSNTYVVNSYASLFMTRPMYRYNPGVDSTIDVEMIDVTGDGGTGTLEHFVRDEAILVR
jgi:hypothetical protein